MLNGRMWGAVVECVGEGCLGWVTNLGISVLHADAVELKRNERMVSHAYTLFVNDNKII